DVAKLLHVFEDRQYWPRAHFDDGAHPFGQHTRKILSDASASDVSHCADAFGFHDATNDRPVALVLLHELVADLALHFVDVGVGVVSGDIKEKFAGQRIAVGVKSGRRQADEYVSRLNVFTGNDLLAIDGADDEASEVVFALRIEARHFGGFTTNQGASIMFAGVCHSADDFFCDFGIELADRQVIHKEERGCALNGDVIDAVVDEVSADALMKIHLEGEFELRPNAVNAGDENRIAELLLVDREKSAKSADLAQHASVESAVSKILDALLGAVSAFDIDAGIGVSEGLRFHARGQGSYFPGKFRESRVLIVTKFKLGKCDGRSGSESGIGR